jgi:hypothetical protein
MLFHNIGKLFMKSQSLGFDFDFKSAHEFIFDILFVSMILLCFFEFLLFLKIMFWWISYVIYVSK